MPDGTPDLPRAQANPAPRAQNRRVEAWRRLGLLWMRTWLQQRARGVVHADVLEQVRDESGFVGRYALMCGLSCGIAILGLLASSPAVIIGAMLISPLMGPIVGLGFSLATFDLPELRIALNALWRGSVIALAIAALIVWLSPLKEPTTEILARVRPTLFDLLVAVFSGVAGAYATIKGRGGAIVGVAIATALMPPLAVVGWALATANWDALVGAAVLFMTNLLAIALSVTVVARIYGFGQHNTPKSNMVQSLIVLISFLGLSIPLGFSLGQIALETHATTRLRELVTGSGIFSEPRVENLATKLSRQGDLLVEASVIVSEYNPDARALLQAALADSIGRTVIVDLDQIELADRASLRRAEVQAALNEIKESQRRAEEAASRVTADARSTAELAETLRASAGFAVISTEIDVAARRAVLHAQPDPMNTPSVLRAMETGLRARLPDWQISVVPSPQGLQPVPFAAGADALGEGALRLLETQAWVLDRWGRPRVDVVGFASASERDGRGLALTRAEAVADYLAALGIPARPVAAPPAPDQTAVERVEGARSWQVVRIRLADPDREGATP